MASATTLPETEEPAQVATPHRWIWLAVGTVIFGHLPLVAEHFCNMWVRPHYQFIIFVPLGMGLLGWRAYQELLEERKGQVFTGGPWWAWLTGFVLSLSSLGFATSLRSPWLGMVSLALSLLSLCLLLFGVRGAIKFLPAWIMLWVAVPLPGNLDLRLINRLRMFTTSWSSDLLDFCGVLHRVDGNVLEIPGMSLFIADACTGIHSLFVLIAAALFFGLWLRRTSVHIVLLVACTLMIVFIENISRVSLVTILCQDHPEFSEGWRHSTLGFVLFAISLLLILSFDSLILFVLPVANWWKLLKSFSKRVQVEDAEPPAERQYPLPAMLRKAMIPVYAVLVALGVTQLTWMPTRAQQLAQMMQRNPIDIGDLGEDAVPAEIAGWKRTGYESIKRVVDDPMGEYSQQWTYEKSDRSLTISLDYPYRRMHDLTSCYRGIGWNITERKKQTLNDLPVMQASMQKSLAGYGVLMFSLHNERGDCEIELKDDVSLTQVYERRVDFELPWLQVQLLTVDHAEWQDAEKSELARVFAGARQAILDRCDIKLINEEL